MSKIRIVNGPYRGREKTLSDKALTIGRDAEAGIQILDRSASRFHAEVFPVGGMFFVRDLDSKNGTLINDEKITDEELLRESDVIKIGSTELIYESGNALAEDDSSSRRIAYREDPDVLSNTIEFRLDELSDIAEPEQDINYQDNARSLRILYQIGRMLSDSNHATNKEVRVLDYLVQSMPAESALIFRREGPSGKLVPSLVRTASPSVQPVISRSIIKKTFSENKALHIANAQDDERFDRSSSVVAKGIRSVICVPLAVGGQTKGVLYLSRGEGATPFDQLELELASACSIQLGMAQHASEQQRRHRQSLWKTLVALIAALEAHGNVSGSGARCARYCVALGEAMNLDPASKDRLRHAGLLHHYAALGAGGTASGKGLEQLDGIEDLEGALTLIRHSTGGQAKNGEEPDPLAHILAVAAAFESRTSANPGTDVPQIIEGMIADAEFDSAVTTALQSCHLNGSLYNAKTD